MKQLGAFVLLMLYFVASTGATMHYHYCMGEITNSSLWANPDEKCGKCGMDREQSITTGCCKDESQWIKIEDDQTINSAHLEVPKLELEALSFFFFNNTLFASEDHHPYAESKAPLRSCQPATYLLNCVFRI